MNIIDEKILVCPVCGAPLAGEVGGTSLVCEGLVGGKRHCFDRAASGYVNLGFVRGHKSISGDPPEAVRSRSEFLDGGYYAPAADAIVRLADSFLPSGVLVDAGCGEGYYSVRTASPERRVIGCDLSKYAVDRAAKRARACGVSDACLFAVASVFELPLGDESADGVLCMFSPCAESEYTRILKRGGVLIVGSAGREHLWGLKKAVYDTPTENEERADLPRGLVPRHTERLRYMLHFDESHSEDISKLFGMTPYRYRTSAEDMRRLYALKTLDTAVDIEFRVYVKP